jgi:hypothetical protein
MLAYMFPTELGEGVVSGGGVYIGTVGFGLNREGRACVKRD